MADQLGTCDLNPEPHSWATHVQQEHHFRPSRWRPLPVKQPTALEREAHETFSRLVNSGGHRIEGALHEGELRNITAWQEVYAQQYPEATR